MARSLLLFLPMTDHRHPTSSHARADGPLRLPALWAKWAWPVLTVAAALGLLFTSWRLSASVERASAAVVQGQGQTIETAVHQYLRSIGRRAERADVAAVRQQLEAQGLRYIRVFLRGPGGVISYDAGETNIPIPHTPDGIRPGRNVELVNGLALLTFGADRPEGPGPGPGPGIGPGRRDGDSQRTHVAGYDQPAPPDEGPPDDPRGRRPTRDDLAGFPPGSPGHTGPGMRRDGPRFGPDGRPGPPLLGQAPQMVLVFEPTLALELEAEATRTWWGGLAGSMVMLLIATLLWRQLRAREEAERHLASERHLAALGEMSATLAHEIRNPLAAVKGHAQLLVATLPEGSKPSEKAHRVVAEVVRLEGLINGLLSFVRSGRIEARECLPADVLRRAASLATDGPVHIDDRTNGARWSLDPGRVEQALVNLIQNAAQASDGKPVTAILERTKAGLEFLVCDQGPGLPDGDPERLFEPFVTTKTRGTGLGLARSSAQGSAQPGRIT